MYQSLKGNERSFFPFPKLFAVDFIYGECECVCVGIIWVCFWQTVSVYAGCCTTYIESIVVDLVIFVLRILFVGKELRM